MTLKWFSKAVFLLGGPSREDYIWKVLTSSMDQFINKLYMNAFLAGGGWLEEVGHWGCPALERTSSSEKPSLLWHSGIDPGKDEGMKSLLISQAAA